MSRKIGYNVLKIEEYSKNPEFLKEYDKNVANFEAYMNSKSTVFTKKFPENKNDLIAYFSAEYGLDEIMQIYSGGLGILSGDHLKASSDLGIPLVRSRIIIQKRLLPPSNKRTWKSGKRI